MAIYDIVTHESKCAGRMLALLTTRLMQRVKRAVAILPPF